MGQIHYFQRYSTAENTVTNNTLQLFSRIYAHSARAASRFLTELCDDAVELGIEVTQQQRGAAGTVPDGFIVQRSLKVLVETKLRGHDPTVEQVRGHAAEFSGESQQFLILLTVDAVPANLRERLFTAVRDVAPHARLVCKTFGDVCAAVRNLFREYEVDMVALVEDYRDYCVEAQLLDERGFILRVVPCGDTAALNLRHRVYFHPSDRAYSPHRYLGIYRNKRVEAIMDVKWSADVTLDGGDLHLGNVEGDEPDVERRVRAAIQEAQALNMDVSTQHRFFAGPVADTNFVKMSPYGIQGPRRLDLREYLNQPILELQELADGLRGCQWR